MSSLLALLSQQAPNLPTRKGLILTGLQHDFLSLDGKLPVNNLESGFLDRTRALIEEFRGHGDVIWIRTEAEPSRNKSDLEDDAYNVITDLTQHDHMESGESSEENASEPESTLQASKKRKSGNRRSTSPGSHGSSRKHPKSSENDDSSSTARPPPVDEEHFLTPTADREACFVKGSVGADFAADVKSWVQPTDLLVTKNYYSAFISTSLLQTLRSKLITELYICGAMTNLNVYATSMDAARYGIKVTLVEDCLGYRKKERHDLAIKRLVDIMDASVMTSEQVITAVNGRPIAQTKNRQTMSAHEPANIEDEDHAAGMLEVASSDEEDDEIDLLSVRDSLYKSHRPLEIRVSKPDSKNLPAGDVGSKERSASQPSQLQRDAAAKPIAGQRRSHHSTKDSGERTGQGEAGQQEAEQHEFGVTPVKLSEKTLEQRLDRDTTRKPSESRHSPGKPAIIAAISPQPATQEESTQKPKPNIKARRRNRKSEHTSAVERQRGQPLLGPSKEEESADSSIQYDLLAPDVLDGLFHKLNEEVAWQKMHHQTGEVPRLVCCQGAIDPDGSMPVYRHPSDETLPLLPWTPAVNEVRKAAEELAGHPLNHAFIQLYRAGTDFISEHSDKTLDITPDSFIVNASFGAERVMRLRTKRTGATDEATDDAKSRTTHRIRLPHNSALLMSLPANARYLHSIQADKRPTHELSRAEKAYDGRRISITFRQIATFLDADSKLIWGQGALEKGREDAHKVVNGPGEETERLLVGFGKENAATEMRWEEWYGEGSDVLHLK